MKTTSADQVPMFRTAVAAIDLSPVQDAMVGCMGDLLHWGIDRLVLVHVLRVGYGQRPGDRALQDIRDSLEAQTVPLRQAGLSVEVTIRTARGVADEFLEAAADAKADLLVVGSRSHNLTSGLFLGSVARAVIRKTRVPLLLQWIEPDTGGGAEAVCVETLRHVLLATDLSKHAQGAERTAVALAPRAGRIDCASVLTPQAIDATPALPVMARAALDDLSGRIAKAGGRGEVILVEGDPKESLARIARERGCSLIIVGKHGQGWVESMVIGSTAASVCETAGRPVLLVP
ncbi:MAG: hypothetical protein ABS54_06660 [Hyphomicrobium sp. SCN 65-11]|nr:MAG: hypothetical protein ABS54_06660 [Hyphomicrobium sp. SCN 65-11]